VSTLDEQVLSQRLHEDLDTLAAPPAPVGPVLHRGRAIRARRWAAAASGLMAGAAAVALVVSAQTGGPAARPAAARTGAASSSPGPARTSSPPGILNSAPPPGGTVFAAGTAGGAAWQLALRNIADRGSSCLPAVMLDGADGDLLSAPANPAGGIISTAFLDNPPGHLGFGYAALQVGPAVTRLTAIFRDGTTLTAHPLSLRACGQQLRLAGFAYPASGVAQITAYSGGQLASTARETVPASMSGPGSAGSATGQPALRLVPGVWEQAGATPAAVASGVIGSGQASGGRWRVSVTLGAAGECFAGSSFGASSYSSGSACQPIGLPPATAVLCPLEFAAQTRLAGYGGLVSPRAATVTATLSGGTTERITPVTVGGRRYLALALPSGTTLTRLTLDDASGHAFATVTSIPPSG
jgi:hypothetical protein